MADDHLSCAEWVDLAQSEPHRVIWDAGDWLQTANEWTSGILDRCGPATPPAGFYEFTQRLRLWCDTQAGIDPTPILTLQRQLDARIHRVYGDKRLSDWVPDAELEQQRERAQVCIERILAKAEYQQSKMQPPPPGKPSDGFLGLRVDESRCIICRDGERYAGKEVDLSRSAICWFVFRKMFSGKESGTTNDALQDGWPGVWSLPTKRSAVRELRNRLIPLSVTIPNRKLHLEELPDSAT